MEVNLEGLLLSGEKLITLAEVILTQLMYTMTT